jgi:hypothetical protein
MYIDFPIIYPKLEENKLKLAITPNNSSLSIFPSSEWEKVKIEDIRLDFEREGKIIK